jgi:phytoene synthase
MSKSADLAASDVYCARIAARRARNFYPSFLLLPRRQRRSMYALYAFMRQTDDIADEPGPIPQKRLALSHWRNSLERTLQGAVPIGPGEWVGWPALARTVACHGIPAPLLHEVIDGVAMDLEPLEFATFEELRVYCYKVAGVVGLCCLHIWGYRSEAGRAEALAESCGIALQLTNILRDIGPDARNGRIYLPRDDLARFGVDVADLAAPVASDRLRRLLAFEAGRAYDEYDRGGALEARVDRAGRPMLRAIVGIYRALLDEIARRDYEVLRRRVSIPGSRKAWIALRAYCGQRFAGKTLDAHAPTLP